MERVIERRRLIFGLRQSIDEVLNGPTLFDRARALRERIDTYESYVQRGISPLDERRWQDSLVADFERWLAEFKAQGGN